MKPIILFEDKSLLIIDKPAGWVVNDSETAHSNPILQDWIAENYDFETAKSRELRGGIVHRLDKETSGIILIAKTKEAFENLQKQFADRKVKKIYTALTHGILKTKKGNINAPIGRLPWKRTKFGVWDGGREASTDYKVIENYKDFTLLNLFPKTGRTHQLRVHLKHIGHPIVGDYLYAGRKTARADRKWCPRIFLHASEITFKHPETGKKINIKSDLRPALKVALHQLK